MKIVLNDENVANDHGFKILNAGIDLSRFNANPVVLYYHKDYQLAIGTLANVRIEGSELVGELTWDSEDDDAEVKRIIGKYERGVMKAFSMGILVTKMVSNVLPNDETENIATQSELYELSALSMGSNKKALVKLMNKNGTTIPLSKGGKMVHLSYDADKIDFSNIIKLNTMVKILAQLMGLPDTATDEDVINHFKTLKADLSVKTARLATLQAGAIESTLRDAEQKGLVTDANKVSFMAMLTANFDGVKAMVDATPAPTKTPTEGGANLTVLAALQSVAGTKPPTTDANDRANWDYDTWSQRDVQGLTRLKATDKAAFNKLLEAHDLKHA